MKKVSIILFSIVAAVLVISLPSSWYIGDPQTSQEEAFSIVNGQLNIPPQRVRFQQNEDNQGQYFAFNETNGKFYSKYGVMNGLLYSGPVILFHKINGFSFFQKQGINRTFSFSVSMLNLVCSMIILFFWIRILKRFTPDPKILVAMTVVTFFCTFLWHYLRAQTTEIFQVMFFLWLFDAFLRRSLFEIWLSLTFLSLGKVSFLLSVPLTAALLILSHCDRRTLVKTIIGASVPIAAVMIVNAIKFGSPLLTGYHQWMPEVSRPHWRIYEGGFGFLFDPQKSLFIHFPLLALALFGVRQFYREHKDASRFVALHFAAYFLFLSSLPGWRGDSSYGPRYLLFLLPVASLPAIYAFDQLRRRKRIAGLVSVLFAMSFCLQLGMNQYDFFAYFNATNQLPKGTYKNWPLPIANLKLRKQFPGIYESLNYYWFTLP